MIVYELIRFSTGRSSTIGGLFLPDAIDKNFQCFTLEDTFNEPKIPGQTRIPSGDYEILLRIGSPMSMKYASKYEWHSEGMLWLQDVPNFEWVYIHPGNQDKDTEGCILVGDTCSNNRGEGTRGSLSGSVTAYKRVYKDMVGHIKNNNQVMISIRDYS